jgi:predicted regulator of Ras-like GTPase activity (Roadblock/LC7/MglB family)
MCFERALKVMNQEGHFQAAVLTTRDGLPIATVPPSFDPDTSAAMVALVREVIHRAQSQLRLAEVDEVSLVDSDRKRLVCRYFSHDGEDFILAIIAPPDHRYRRVTAQAIHIIKEALSG